MLCQSFALNFGTCYLLTKVGRTPDVSLGLTRSPGHIAMAHFGLESRIQQAFVDLRSDHDGSVLSTRTPKSYR